jgi:hypothetical protein
MESVDVSVTALNLSLDDPYHQSIYGEEKTVFQKNEAVYLKIYPAYAESNYSLVATGGSISKHNTALNETVTETLTFAKEKEATLSRDPVGSVSVSWVAGSGSLVFDGRRAYSTTEILGVAQATYQAKYDRLKLVTSESMTADVVLVVAESETHGKASIDVEYEVPLIDPDLPVSVTLTIRDIVSDTPIPNAQVSVSGHGVSFSGTADGGGQVTIPNLERGKTYDVVAQASGYFSSNVDYLNNDSFTVPTV